MSASVARPETFHLSCFSRLLLIGQVLALVSYVSVPKGDVSAGDTTTLGRYKREPSAISRKQAPDVRAGFDERLDHVQLGAGKPLPSPQICHMVREMHGAIG